MITGPKINVRSLRHRYHQVHQEGDDYSKNTFIISLIIIYGHRNTIMLKVLGTVIYIFIEKLKCLDDLFLNHNK